MLNQRSRLYLAKEWVKINDANSLLSLDKFNEDDLYENLDWLSKNQEKIEQRLFNIRYKGKDIQFNKLKDNFGVKNVVMVGDKGML